MASSPSNLQLRFTCNKLKVPAYTKRKIYAGNGHDVEVAIYSNGEAIRSGPLSSLKVEMVVLPGDFSKENNSTAEEVDRQIVISRHGQGSVLDGVCTHKLANGSYSFADICFREGSVRTRTREFILAARVVNEDIDGLRIQEAFMDPVTVLDRRSESNEKSDPPKLDDKVNRLKGIAKNGTYFKRLQGANIRTVEDFLKAYNRHKKNLREVVLKIMSEKCKIWETMVQHATECDLKDKDELKAYKILGGNAQIFFNCVHYIVGAEFSDGYIAKENFNPQQKALVDRHKIQAYNELKSIGYDYVMLENSPVKICMNVRGGSSFPIEDAVSQPNPADHNVSFQAADDNSSLPFADPLQTIPTHANCSTAATLFFGGGASEALFDHPQVVSDGYGYDGWGQLHSSTAAVEEGRFYWDNIQNDEFSLEELWASSDQVGYSVSGNHNMIIIPEGFCPGELLASSDQANYSAFLPPSTRQQTAKPGNGNIHFDGSNQISDITTSAYHPSEHIPHYCQEIEFQSGGIVVPVGNNATPLVSAQNPTPKSTYISQRPDTGISFTDGTRANAYNKDGLQV